jgi:hypothetical protein
MAFFILAVAFAMRAWAAAMAGVVDIFVFC